MRDGTAWAAASECSSMMLVLFHKSVRWRVYGTGTAHAATQSGLLAPPLNFFSAGPRTKGTGTEGPHKQELEQCLNLLIRT